MSENKTAKTPADGEPVAWMKPSGLISPYKHGSYTIPLYTFPPKRDTESSIPEGRRPEWVGLTKEDIKEGVNASRLYEDQFEPVALWVEAKLKEKNT